MDKSLARLYFLQHHLKGLEGLWSSPCSLCPLPSPSCGTGHPSPRVVGQHTGQPQNTVLATQGCIQDPTQGLLLPCFCFIAFSKELIFGNLQHSKSNRNTQPKHLWLLFPYRELLTHPFLSGSNLWTCTIMTHEATLKGLISPALSTTLRAALGARAGPQAHKGHQPTVGSGSCVPVQH